MITNILSQGVFILKIEKCGENKAKIILDKADLKKLDISFSSFEEDVIKTQVLLSNLIALLCETKIIYCDGDDVRVDVTESTDNEIIIYIEPEKAISSTHETVMIYSFCDTFRLIDFCKNNLLQARNRITDDKLYFYGEKYFLIIKFRYAKSTVLGKQNLRNGTDDKILCAKIKEYGEKISDTPLEKILLLP